MWLTGTLNLSMCADSSTNTKKFNKKTIFFYFFQSCFRCQVSHIKCHLSPVTCRKSLMLTVRATDPPPVCTEGCCCWSLHRSIQRELWKPKNQKCFCGSFWPFLIKNCNIWEQGPFIIFCSWYVWLLTYVNLENTRLIRPQGKFSEDPHLTIGSFCSPKLRSAHIATYCNWQF